MKYPAILSSHQLACKLQKRWKNGIKSRGRGGNNTRNVFGLNFIQLISSHDTRLEDGKAGNETAPGKWKG
eukprot:1142852-Pelagomonas_calceolata.AAC.4